jgi:PAT family beta-lactamase induction signal transducer AmpG
MEESRKSAPAWRIYLKPEAVRMFFFGFSAGLPLLLVIGTLGFWLREAGIDLKTIGFMSWIGLIYGCKWLWAPLVDNLAIPVLTRKMGQRRAWLLLSQSLIIFGLFGIALSDPKTGLSAVAFFALLTAFSSATQDISLDAYRIECAPTDMQGALAATYQTGYRLAMIWAGAGAFALAAFQTPEGISGYYFPAWSFSYCVMALSMSFGILTTVLAPAPESDAGRRSAPEKEESRAAALQTRFPVPRILAQAAVFVRDVCLLPFVDFLTRYRWQAVLILSLIATYRICDVVMGVMSNPFYQDMGFTKQEIAAVSKVFGVLMTLLGAFVGGILVTKIGVMKTLFLGALSSALTNLLFAALALIGHSVPFLILTVSADNLAGGMASAAFIAYLSGLTNLNYSATQYALFSSLMLILPKFLAGFSGITVEAWGYQSFFCMTAALGIPALILIPFAAKFTKLRA